MANTYTVSATNTLCWIVALHEVYGVSKDAIRRMARKHGWDGVTFGVPVNIVLLCQWDIIGHKPAFMVNVPTSAKSFHTVKPTATGLVFVDGHVMPMVNGLVSNFCGYGDEKVVLFAS